jgi:hypothetical protein
MIKKMKLTQSLSHQLSRTFFSGSMVAIMIASTTGPVFAASPSPTPSAVVKASPSPLPSPSADTTQKLKERIDKVIEKRRDQVKGIIDQMSSEKRGFIGEIQRVTEKTVSVKTTRGEQELFTLDDTIPVLKDNKKITIDDIAVGDWAIAMGYMSKDEFSLKKLLISSTSLLPRPYETKLGNIKTVSTTQLVIIARPDQDQKTYVLNKATKYQDANGNPIDRKALHELDQVLVISFTDKNNQVVHTIRSLATQ